MKLQSDPVLKTESERLYYSTGELLGADDFRAEQSYHRRQLAAVIGLFSAKIIRAEQFAGRVMEPFGLGFEDGVGLQFHD